jgi:hypothetical protein
LLFLFIVAIGVVRIANTWRKVSQTSDESPNIACGMQWLDLGRYDYGPFHPPLARAAIASLLYLHGYRAQNRPDRWAEGNAILHSKKDYDHALKWARAGTLPFFIVACIWVWLWSRRLLGDWAALIPVLLFTNTPPILAHAGLATTDMAVAAGVCGALYSFTLWLERPDSRRTVLLGATFALAFLAKFSAILFVPAGALGIVILYALAGNCTLPLRSLIEFAALFTITAMLLIWAAYQFSWGRTTEHIAEDAQSQSGVWGKIPQSVLVLLQRTPLPAPEIVDGMWTVHNHNEAGHGAYLLGRNSLHGWWYFFPVALAVKTPLGLLMLAGAGFVVLMLRNSRPLDWKKWAPAIAAILILLSSMPANLNGVRYVLAIYPLLAIVAGLGCVHLFQSENARIFTAAVGSAVVLWVMFSGALAHPHYIAYFNEIANAQPENFLVDSDLDWGQDLRVLAKTLKRLKVERIHMDCFYTGDGAELDLPAWEGLKPYKPETGWVAVSFTPVKSYWWGLAQKHNRRDSPYAWLDAYEPHMRVGRSILLYHIPEKL